MWYANLRDRSFCFLISTYRVQLLHGRQAGGGVLGAQLINDERDRQQAVCSSVGEEFNKWKQPVSTIFTTKFGWCLL